MSKELTAEECFKSTELAKFKNKKSFTKETMFDFAEHYHEVKSKEERELDEERRDTIFHQNTEIIKLRGRIKELEEGVEEAKYMLKLKSVGTIGDKPIIEKLEQTLKTK